MADKEQRGADSDGDGGDYDNDDEMVVDEVFPRPATIAAWRLR